MGSGSGYACEMRPVELPLKIVHNRPLVQLTYRHGSTSVDAWTLLDTGGGSMILGRGLRDQLQLAAVGDSVPEDGQVLTPVQAPEISSAEVRLPGRNCTVFASDQLEVSATGGGATVFLPAAFLRQFTATFDYPNGRLKLEPPGTPWQADHITPASVHAESGFPRIELNIGGEVLGFLLDTGAPYSMISEAVYQRWSAKHPAWPTSSGAHGYAQMTGHPFEGETHMIRVPEATLGQLSVSNLGFVTRPEGTFEKYMSAWTTAPIVGALAGNLLRHLKVVIDYGQQLAGLAPMRVDAGGDLYTLGLGLQHGGGRWSVQSISETAVQARSQVQLGDIVQSANGAPLTGLGLTGAVDALRGRLGDAYDVQLRRNGLAIQLRLPVVGVLG
jgi:Aspartyl protease